MSVDDILEKVIAICQEYSAREVYLYGSRAKGVSLERSDIDIAVAGIHDFDALAEKVDALETLYTIDLLDLDHCKNTCLLEDIRLYGRKIYEKI